MDRALRILVVDDEPDILETLEYSLAKKGYEVATALDGLEGLDKAKRLPPDFMILDVMLPGCNGYEVSRMLKEWMENDPEAKPFPIMLLTARKVDSHDREKFIATWSRAARMALSGQNPSSSTVSGSSALQTLYMIRLAWGATPDTGTSKLVVTAWIRSLRMFPTAVLATWVP